MPKVTVRFKDAGLNMLSFVDLSTLGLWRSPRLAEKQPQVVEGNLIYNLCTNFSTPNAQSVPKPKTYQERIMCAQEQIHTLIDISLNYLNEIMLAIIDNKLYYLQDMLK